MNYPEGLDLRTEFELEVPRVLGLVLGDGLDTLRELGENLFGIPQSNRIGLGAPLFKRTCR
jgi:hypothetical protein